MSASLQRHIDEFGSEGVIKAFYKLKINNYEEFIKTLYGHLDRILSDLEEGANLRHKDSEDRLTIEIINCLRQHPFDEVNHDPNYNGHADIVVKFKDYKWIGEAKIHSSYDWLKKGLSQILKRYTTGTEKQVGLIIFIRNKNAKKVMDDWRGHLEKEKLHDFVCSNEDERNRPYTFESTHIHHRSGLQVLTRHMGCSIYFNPKED